MAEEGFTLAAHIASAPAIIEQLERLARKYPPFKKDTGSKNKNRFLCEACKCSERIDVSSPSEEISRSRNEATDKPKDNSLENKVIPISSSKTSEYCEDQNRKFEENGKSENMDVTESANSLLDPASQVDVCDNTGIGDTNISEVGIASVNDQSDAENSNDKCSLLTEDTASPRELIASHSGNECSEIQERETEDNINIVENKKSEIKEEPRRESPFSWLRNYRLGLDEWRETSEQTSKILHSRTGPELRRKFFQLRNGSLKKDKIDDSPICKICYSSLFPEPDSTASEDLTVLNRIESEKSASALNSEGINQNRTRSENIKFYELILSILLCIMPIAVAVYSYFGENYGEQNLLRTCKPKPSVNQFMSYMLIGEFEDAEFAEDANIYSFASMCGMKNLLQTKSSKFQSSITLSNAWITYVLADAYQDEKLKESALSFLKNSSNETLLFEKWKTDMTAVTDNYIADYESSHFQSKGE